jgi:hypothetical protein
MSVRLEFKNERAREEYGKAPKRLKELVEFFADYVCYFCGQSSVTITRVKEPLSFGTESGVHPAGRAVDLRDEHYGENNGRLRLFTDAQVGEITDVVNRRFPRDDGRGVIIHHAVSGSLLHWHCQIPAAWLTDEERTRL